MVTRLRIWAAVAALAAFAVLGRVPDAHATFTVTLSDGTSSQSFSGATSVAQFNVNIGGYNINLVAGDSQSTPTLGKIELTSLSVTNNGDAAPLTIKITQDTFTQPLSSTLGLKDQITATSPTGAFTLSSTSTGTGTGVGGTSATTSSVSLTNSPGSNGATSAFSSGTTGFSLEQDLTLTLANNASVSILSETDALAPAPGSLTLAFTGLACCGPLVWLRRRRVAPMAV